MIIRTDDRGRLYTSGQLKMCATSSTSSTKFPFFVDTYVKESTGSARMRVPHLMYSTNSAMRSGDTLCTYTLNRIVNNLPEDGFTTSVIPMCSWSNGTVTSVHNGMYFRGQYGTTFHHFFMPYISRNTKVQGKNYATYDKYIKRAAPVFTTASSSQLSDHGSSTNCIVQSYQAMGNSFTPPYVQAIVVVDGGEMSPYSWQRYIYWPYDSMFYNYMRIDVSFSGGYPTRWIATADSGMGTPELIESNGLITSENEIYSRGSIKAYNFGIWDRNSYKMPGNDPTYQGGKMQWVWHLPPVFEFDMTNDSGNFYVAQLFQSVIF